MMTTTTTMKKIIIREITETKMGIIEILKIIDKTMMMMTMIMIMTMTIKMKIKTIKRILKIIINNPIISKRHQTNKIMEINQVPQRQKVKIEILTKLLFPKKNSENLNLK